MQNDSIYFYMQTFFLRTFSLSPFSLSYSKELSCGDNWSRYAWT